MFTERAFGKPLVQNTMQFPMVDNMPIHDCYGVVSNPILHQDKIKAYKWIDMTMDTSK